ncbi:MAG: FKBP-type peptidyl-prolyl cis-trans isomerase [Wenzhouxiangella sp.]|nr:MAG: FKBP-type peptidyl-prolyl cis-trans isomerase [Nitriliruptor sp.]TVS13709.1 MAG: FKBP-type peptidyl-prolyl cis-trans isomerase [Wenzhouxiangella sp.]
MGSAGRKGSLAGVVAGLVLLAGCADERADEALDDVQEEAAVSQDVGERPVTDGLVPADGTEPPSELQVEDLVVGDGELASPGDLLSVQYVGVRWSDGGEFDASWERGQPLEFQLGAGQVISGWEQGVEGMRVGGRRVITIPPQLAYGDRGAGGVIGPGETLVFVVDLQEVS